ncbi:hypothetical protein [Streptomyces himalayensis]|uniref:Uncharacterized protein n=1 Tax=Streptomyces himalayensis subsp. himalayensis TaxID=2756131 RepID=A0A7W0DM05_9ACTN|nr:hypothetical protein [Streptomyces himalayensis]MBA2947470.1 hypothetical protein [Streptomyces himalayensis subsp. himalayensis]
MRIRTTVAAAVLAVGALFGGAGAAVADNHTDVDVDIPGIVINVPGIDWPEDLYDWPIEAAIEMCNAWVEWAQQLDPDFNYTCPTGPTG